MEMHRADDRGGIANLGLILAEAKRLLAGVQREIICKWVEVSGVTCSTRQPGT